MTLLGRDCSHAIFFFSGSYSLLDTPGRRCSLGEQALVGQLGCVEEVFRVSFGGNGLVEGSLRMSSRHGCSKGTALLVVGARRVRFNGDF